MELTNITDDDLPLYESINCDPRMMAGLGGVFPRERVPQMLRKALDAIEAGTAWVFKVIPGETATQAAGTVCIWENSWRDEIINEIGWMILPQFQGQGLGSKAVRAILDKAQAERHWDVIRAFPSITNAPSNAICRKMGFSLIEECDLEWSERILRCNHWRLNLL